MGYISNYNSGAFTPLYCYQPIGKNKTACGFDHSGVNKIVFTTSEKSKVTCNECLTLLK